MENGGLRRSISSMRQSLFDEGILNGQFTQLEQLHRNNPLSVQRYFTEYFTDSTELLDKVEQEMKIVPFDFLKTDMLLNELRRDSGYIGANKVRNETNRTRELLQAGNLGGVNVALHDLRNQLDILQTKLKPYFQQKRLQALLTENRLPGSEAITPRQ